MKEQNSAKKCVKKSNHKAIKVTAILLASFLGAYILACFCASGYSLITMGVTNSRATNVEGGQVRYKELSAKIQVEYELENGITLYHFPADNQTTNEFVLICPGGGYTNCAIDSEGFPIANEFNCLGISCFILRYRIDNESSYHAPLDDVACALNFIFESQEKFNVSDVYSLCGFSAGGNLTGLFGTSEWGYGNYDLPKPKLLIMGYPWLSPVESAGWNIVHTCYFQILNNGGRTAFLGKGYTKEDTESMDVNLWIDENYPPCYIIHGASDTIVPCETSSRKADTLLTQYNIPHVYKEYAGLNHGGGLFENTIAEGWIKDAVEFSKTL